MLQFSRESFHHHRIRISAFLIRLKENLQNPVVVTRLLTTSDISPPQVCDVISRWETALREKGLGKFENRRVIRFSYKNRLFWRRNIPGEGDKERMMLAYQVSRQIVQGQFPLNRDLAFELAALMAQVRAMNFASIPLVLGQEGNGSSVHCDCTLVRWPSIYSVEMKGSIALIIESDVPRISSSAE